MMITAQTSTTGWAFLVARGRHTDYRTVLAPDFLVDMHGYGALSYAVTQQDARPGQTRTITVPSTQGERLRVYYRTEALDTQGAWPDAPDALLDEHGRAFEIVYGVVTRSSAQAAVNDHDLEQAREEALAAYRHFLEHEDDAGVARSAAFAVNPGIGIETATFTEPTRGTEARTPPPRSRPVRLIAAGAAAVVALAAIGVAIAGSSGSSPRLELGAQSLACAQPLVASITTNGAQTLHYQWTSASGAILRQGQLRFGGAGSQRVSLRTSGQGTVRLHVSAAGQTRVLTFRC